MKVCSAAALPLAFALLLGTTAPLSAAELLLRGELVVLPNAPIAVKATESVTVLALPVPAGSPVSKGTLLAELDLQSLQRALDNTVRELEAAKTERRDRPPVPSGRSTGPAESPADLAIRQGTTELLNLQSRLGRAPIRAPEDGYVVRHFFAPGSKSRKRKPFLEFAGLPRLRVQISLAAAEADRFRVGKEVELVAADDGLRRFRGRVEAATPGDGGITLAIRPLELPFLELGVAAELRLTD